MTSRSYLAVTLTITLAILAIKTDAWSWDLAVVIGPQVEFFSRNRTLTGQAKVAEPNSRVADLAYDDATDTMYFSEIGGDALLSSNNLTEKNFASTPLLDGHPGSYIAGIAFDTRTRNLFWTDARQEVVMKMHVPLDGKPEAPVLLHNMTNRIPRGIAVDPCNSHIYWANSNNANPSVERSNLDGTERVTVVKETLYLPLAVAIDHAEGKLYWIDDVEGLHAEIVRGNLDGSDREVVVHIQRQQPLHLTVDRESVYWTDAVARAVWTAPKNGDPDDSPVMFRSYYVPGYEDNEPAGIVARDNAGGIDCAAIAAVGRRTNFANASSPRTAVESVDGLTTVTGGPGLTTEGPNYCLHGGQADETDGGCRCRRGFSGAHCETNLCHNYCVHGSCVINSDGLPTCVCSYGFAGPRCETDPCRDYCLHDSQCSVQNGMPICKCNYTEGSRCERFNDVTKVCEIFCAYTGPIPASIGAISCRCGEGNETIAQMIMARGRDANRTWLPIIGTSIAVLVLVIIVLSYYVNKLRKRACFIREARAIKTGATSRTSTERLPGVHCPVALSICETQCFEPKVRTVPESNGIKKEEKNCLLDNMDGYSW